MSPCVILVVDIYKNILQKHQGGDFVGAVCIKKISRHGGPWRENAQMF